MDIDQIGTQPGEQDTEVQTVLVGVAPLTMVKTIEGGYVNVYPDQVVPLNADPKDTERLLAEQFLATIQVVAEPVALDPQVQAVLDQQSGVIAQLAADRQDQAAKIEELTSKLAALEGQATAAPGPAPAAAAGEPEKKTSGTSSRSRSS